MVSFLKCHLVIVLPQNSSESLFNSGSFISFCIGTKSNLFSSIPISKSVKTSQLKLKNVSEQNRYLYWGVSSKECLIKRAIYIVGYE